jgi:NAD(P)H-hydrate epimerase
MSKSDSFQHRIASLRLLTPQQMYAADAATIAAGTPGIELMENAGKAVFREIMLRWSKRPALVLCGPGNNGGDGYVVARLLQEEGWPVRTAALGEPGKLKGDAKIAYDAWQGQVEPLTSKSLGDARLIVDALFGAGLARPVDGVAGEVIHAVNTSGLPVVAVDVPSGVDGATGQMMGATVSAQLTVTFCRRKPGHLLLPGRDLCGATVCADIGVSADAVSLEAPHIFANAPALWPSATNKCASDVHKYHRGHALVMSGPAGHTGAARLAAGAALQAGAGLVTLASPIDAMAENASHLTAVMLTPLDAPADLERIVNKRKISAIAAGPGCGVDGRTRSLVRVALSLGRPVVLDADALTSFAADPSQLFAAIRDSPARPVVLTPHEGEFRRLFGQVARNSESKWQRAAAAAQASGAVVVLKGADTVVAAPGGPIAINENAPTTLATAGSGDVLTGIICALLAGKAPAFEAACAAVWLHGASASLNQHVLTAEDLASAIPLALKTIC